jgi:hypothetical protein
MERLKDVFHRSRIALEAGDYEAALNDLIWIHDNPDHSDPSSEVFRRAYGSLAWATLANVYPPAGDSMRTLLEMKLQHLELHPEDSHAKADAAAIKAALAMYEAKQL